MSITRPRLFQKPLSRLFIIHYCATLFSLSVLFLFYKDFYGVVVIRTFIVFLTNHRTWLSTFNGFCGKNGTYFIATRFPFLSTLRTLRSCSFEISKSAPCFSPFSTKTPSRARILCSHLQRRRHIFRRCYWRHLFSFHADKIFYQFFFHSVLSPLRNSVIDRYQNEILSSGIKILQGNICDCLCFLFEALVPKKQGFSQNLSSSTRSRVFKWHLNRY